MSGPKILIWDIETAPLEALVWGLYDQTLGLNQIKKDRSVLSFAAKWLDDKKVMYAGTGGQRNVRDDKKVIAALRDLLDEADIIITQNGKKFDEPIVKGRMAIHGMQPPSGYRHIDTCQLARKMGFPSNKLEYLSENLAPELAKSKHNSFPGMSLWTECLKGNKKAWREMEAYNKQDVLATEAVYKKLAPFGTGINFSIYHDGHDLVCSCGSKQWVNNGHAYSRTGKFRKYKCKKCGASYTESGQANNLLSKDKQASMKGKVA